MKSISQLTRLTAALFVIGLMSCSTPSSTGQVRLDAQSFNQQINATSNPQIIDVRTPEEYNSGHLTNAQNLNIYASNFSQSLDLLDKDDTVFVYCKAGGRSAQAAQQLVAKGFKHVYDLNGGIMQWQKAKLPLEGDSNTKSTMPGMSVQDFDSLMLAYPLVVVDFYAPWCAPCKQMAPYLKKLSENYDETKLKIVKIDVDQNQTLLNHFGIDGIPLIKFYHKGQLVKDHLGFISETDMMAVLKPYLD
ncbi:MAG: redoxin domain-containing protein [Flavobacteriales bacterium]|nr:redoxin domain-containing protein [Bacteroidota bacterium]MCB9241185.1 redoxin domain-containing protein [Flavobacteriales bacterium]